ncbi:carboxymuconolactone decarboxylase family protein [Acidovorax sp. M2(2025)]|uniref:carboxymuconolactone decarboxylase family protein n=1 Tax=Acidovorax sp. M2(2025) TaxID=3411355 RepID=UPI003BF5C4DF
MARIPYFDMNQASPAIKDLVSSRPPLNIYRMVAHGGPTAEGFLALGTALLRKSELNPQLRELVILRVGALCGAAYEVFQHRRVATHEGVSSEKIEAVLSRTDTEPDSEIFTRLEMDALRYTDAVVRQVKAPVELFRALEDSLSHKQLVEITTLIGFYMLVSRFLENFEVDIESPV